MTTNPQSFQFYGKVERKAFKDPMSDNNPVTVQVLGICSASRSRCK